MAVDDHNGTPPFSPGETQGGGARLQLSCDEGDAPRWLLLNPKLQESAREITEDISGHEFVLLSGLRPPTSGATELRHEVVSVQKLVPLLWHSEGLSTSWLRHVFGPSMSVVQKVAESSDLNKVYRCLDCEVPLRSQGRELFLRRRNSLKVVLAADAGGIISTENLRDLLCPSCTDVYLVARLIRIEELREIARNSYQEYLRTLEWQKIRAEKLNQAGRYCHACRKLGTLNVHHNRYTDLGDEDMSDLFIFCRSCHQRHHGIRREAA